MLSKIRNKVALNLLNYRGWTTDRKIVVIESDDWGSIRMPSMTAFKNLQMQGIPVHKSPYCRFDSLASEQDLTKLFETLSEFEDSQKRSPVFTANSVTANPNFEKIQESGFSQYEYELITETLKKYPEHANSFKLWQEGYEHGLFFPQFHGREHLNVSYWLNILNSGNEQFLHAFENKCWGLSCDVFPGLERSVQASYDMVNREDLKFHKESIVKGLNHFEEIFGYRSKSFIASNFIWHPKINKTLAENGVEFLQGMKYQKLPLSEGKKRRLIRHFIGDQNELGQTYLVRNCTFEPSLNGQDYDNVGKCLQGISNAFYWKKPAIITTHRINYIGYLDDSNRDQNLELLKKLLCKIMQSWPEVEFLTTVELGKLIQQDTKEEVNKIFA